MIDYYGIETSPRKLEPDYIPVRKQTSTTKTTKTSQIKKVNKINNQSNKANKVKNAKNTTIKIVDIVICFAILLLISYRYALINTSFEEKEKLKKSYAAIQKQNEQLKVTIEQKMNVSTIEKEAKEKLGMQKLDNNQKVYVNLEKTDYIESSSQKKVVSQNQTWWSKLIKDIFKIK